MDTFLNPLHDILFELKRSALLSAQWERANAIAEVNAELDRIWSRGTQWDPEMSEKLRIRRVLGVAPADRAKYLGLRQESREVAPVTEKQFSAQESRPLPVVSNRLLRYVCTWAGVNTDLFEDPVERDLAVGIWFAWATQEQVDALEAKAERCPGSVSSRLG